MFPHNFSSTPIVTFSHFAPRVENSYATSGNDVNFELTASILQEFFFFFSIMLYNLLQKYTFLILIISLRYYVINNSDLEKRRKSDNYVETFERKLYDFPPTFFPQFPFITLSRVLTNSDTNYVCINYSSSARTKLSIHPRLFPFSFIFQAK